MRAITFFTLILAIPLIIGCHKTTALDNKVIEDGVKQHLPIGTPIDKVDLYLTNHKIEHSLYKPENRIYAIVRDTRKYGSGMSESFSVIFSFDGSNNLTNVQSKIEYTGP
jgi:hypothetical protein